MKRFFTLLLLAIFVTGIQAQQKVTLRDIAQGTYRAPVSYTHLTLPTNSRV